MTNSTLCSPRLPLLLVEDNPGHAMLIMRSMEDQALPCDVHHVTDGEAALDFLFRRGIYRSPANPPRPSLVLLDLRMPKVDGLTVLESIKSDRHLCTIPVVVLTSSETDSDIAKAYERRANSYLVKPGSYGAFLELTRSVHQYWLTLNRCTVAAPGSAS